MSLLARMSRCHLAGVVLSQRHSFVTPHGAFVIPHSKRALSSSTIRYTQPAVQSTYSVITSEIEGKKVEVDFGDGQTSRFHHFWLRDHCRCPECFHAVTKQRLVNTFQIPPDIKPGKVESKEDGLHVHWQGYGSENPHTSFYPWAWLKRHSYDPQLPRQVDRHDLKVHWGSEIQRSSPSVTYDEVMASDDLGLYKWLANIDKLGFCFVEAVPASAKATEELAERIGFIRETQYGKFWEFTSDLTHGDTAYTTLALGAHTDNTYFTDPCGLQLFHLLSHTDGSSSSSSSFTPGLGGATLLVDGFNAARILKETDRKAYEVLKTVGVPAHAAGEEGCLYTPSPLVGYPVLRVEKGNGGEERLVQVRWNNDDRSVLDHLGAEEVEEWYRAIRVWNRILTDKGSEYWVQLKPGTAVIVDNHRVLHGRSSFTGKRHMCGAYIGVDEYKSKLAVLRERYAPGMVERALREKGSKGRIEEGRSVWGELL